MAVRDTYLPFEVGVLSLGPNLIGQAKPEEEEKKKRKKKKKRDTGEREKMTLGESCNYFARNGISSGGTSRTPGRCIVAAPATKGIRNSTRKKGRYVVAVRSQACGCCLLGCSPQGWVGSSEHQQGSHLA